eukprot:Em0003g1046a
MDDTFKHIQSIQWHTTRARRPKGAPGTSGSPETPESKWKQETLYVILDSVLSSMRNSEMYNTVYDLTRAVTSFCEKYNLDSKRICICTQADDRSSDEDDMEQDHDHRDADVDYNDFIKFLYRRA